MVRVLVADDSPTARQLIVETLRQDPALEVVGEAGDGLEAVRLTERLRPDVITLDIHMPHLDGFEATERIMAEVPTPIVIVSSSSAVHEVATSMKALRAGALTLLLKPGGPTTADYDKACRELIETVKAMSEVKVVRRRRGSGKLRPATPSATTPMRDWSAPVGIAASTGGPPALQSVLSQLPATFAAPVLIVQHIAAGFIEGFAAWLDTVVPMYVKLAESGETLRPGRVYVAPEDQHLGVTGEGKVIVTRDPPIGGFRPSGTLLFESLATGFGAQALGVMLTGMGTDGVEGLRAIHRAGGRVLVQDQQSCVVFGMPGAAVAAGVADKILPLDQIAAELLRTVQPPLR